MHRPRKIGKVTVMVRASYGLKNSGEYWGEMCIEILHDMDFVLMVADPEVYHRQERKSNGKYYYE